VPRNRQRFDDDEPRYQSTRKQPIAYDVVDEPIPGGGDRWSTWDQSTPLERGPTPYPSWVVTDLGAVDLEYGVLKTGKEADVFLLRREVPDTDRSTLLAAKRYRSSEHRQFHRDAGYLEGRRMRRSREMRAMQNRTEFGRQLIAGQWAAAEFGALATLWSLGVSVPYPVQITGTEVLLEFIGDPDGTAAPRLAQVRDGLSDLWDQLVYMLVMLARAGLAHGDLSPYNLLVHRGTLVMIDLPQVVDVVANPQGPAFLERDAANVAGWFAHHGVPDTATLADLLRAEVGLP
jgi:RIO kinase 1